MITAGLLSSLYGIHMQKAQPWVVPFACAVEGAELNTANRLSAFLAQVGHESGNSRYVRELWGPTAQQLRYEPTTTLSKRLGNTQPGDGKRYMGRGLIQLTGRANYAEFGKLMKLDLLNQPELLTLPGNAVRSAVLFWNRRNLNRFADSGNFLELTRRINGGYNGLAHRQALYTKALLLCSKSSQPS